MGVCDGCGVVVLAAGRGSRMGGPKTLMRVDGRAWWEDQHERLVSLGGECRWVVTEQVRRGMYDGEWKAAEGIEMVVVESGRPMFDSLFHGIAAWLNEHGGAESVAGVYVLPVDVPVAKGDVWRVLREAAVGRPAVPVYAKEEGAAAARGHPVYLPTTWIVSELVPAVREAAAWNKMDELRLDRLIGTSRVLQSVDDPAVIANLNTHADVRAWVGRHKQS